jgi:hypothetical protein
VGTLLLTEERKGTLAPKVRRWQLDGVHRLRAQQALDVPWPDVVGQSVTYCREHVLGLLVVDTFSRWAGIEKENDAGAVLAAVAPLEEAAAAGLAVCVFSHQRKSPGRFGEAVRGSNALTGAVDVVVELERSQQLRGENLRVLRAVSRYDQTPDDLVAELTDGGYEPRGDTVSAKTCEDLDEVAAAVTALGSATTDEIAAETDLPTGTVRRHAAVLFESERIGRTGTGRKGNPYVWHSEFVSATRDSLGGGMNLSLLEGDAT